MYSESYQGGGRDFRGGNSTDTQSKAGDSSHPASTSLDGVWEGDSKIMIGIDIGSTQSGVAFAFLQNGVPQTVHRVTRWPGQALDHQSKIPTLIWYHNGKAVSFGAEAVSPDARENAEDQQWSLAKHFKLHLHPNEIREKHSLKLDPLPNGVPLSQIYADFIRYLLQHTKAFFEDRIVDGNKIWANYHSEITYVIAHPNGWTMREQNFLRRAAVDAGLLDHVEAKTRVRFVTEAEASVHYCLRYTNISSKLQVGSNFAVCDAGGSTVDTTVYTVTSTWPILKLAEKRDSACVQAGGIFVDQEVETYLQAALTKAQMSLEDVEEYTRAGVEDFEAYPKRLFSDDSENLRIKLGHRSLRNLEMNIRNGTMTLPGSLAKKFFEHCVKSIIKSVDEQIRGIDVSYILLVGGFGDSPYLQKQLKARYDAQGCELTIANDSTSKAVADGAVRWRTLTSVFERAPRWSYGIQGYVRFDSYSADHIGRPTFTTPDGYEKVSGVWCEVAKKGASLDVESVYRQPFVRTYSTPRPNLENFEIALYCYAGDDTPGWLRTKNGTLLKGFQNVCLITADLRSLSGALESRIGPRGKYWGLMFWVCIRFGDTELSAYLEWEENGETRYGPVSVILAEIDGN